MNNHTGVWGSFYDRRTGKWGFRCCHSVIRNSYCTGEEGRRANEQHISELGALVGCVGLVVVDRIVACVDLTACPGLQWPD